MVFSSSPVAVLAFASSEPVSRNRRRRASGEEEGFFEIGVEGSLGGVAVEGNAATFEADV